MSVDHSHFEQKQDPRLFTMAALLRLQQRMQWADLDELRFICVNETKELLSYSQAILWEARSDALSSGQVTAVSNTPYVDKNTPFLLFIRQLIKTAAQQHELNEFRILKKSDFHRHVRLQNDWDEWFGAQILWCPLHSESSDIGGGMLLSRSQPWTNGDKNLIEKLSNSFLARLTSLLKNKQFGLKSILLGKTKIKLAVFAIALASFFPIHASVLSPAEIVAHDPYLVRSPIDGIVQKIHVKPNQKVAIGQLLVSFDPAEINARLAVAENAVKLAQTQVRQTTQEALGDINVMAKVATAKSKVKRELVELEYVKKLISKNEIRASNAGVVVFEDAYDWLGRPVVTGERIMLLADPEKTKLEIRLDVQNKIDFPKNADISFFSNATPHKPFRAELSYSSYRSTKTADNIMAYHLTADWKNESKKLILGQKGTAKLYGYKYPIIWQILRKPLTRLRQFAGL